MAVRWIFRYKPNNYMAEICVHSLCPLGNEPSSRQMSGLFFCHDRATRQSALQILNTMSSMQRPFCVADIYTLSKAHGDAGTVCIIDYLFIPVTIYVISWSGSRVQQLRVTG